MKLTTVVTLFGGAVILSARTLTPAAGPLACDLAQYKSAAGLTVALAQDQLVVNWRGERETELRARYAILDGQPLIRDLAVRKAGATWAILGENLKPEYRVVTGVRRMSTQQADPLRAAGVELTPDVIAKNRWYAFWDAPLFIPEPPAAGPEDDLYPNFPVNYIKLDRVPGPDEDWSPVLKALRDGEFFVTTGEILIRSYAVEGTGDRRTVTADVEWTFPLSFVEVVWGDGNRIDRQVLPATDVSAFGSRHFSIPFDAKGKAWVRFAVWDSAGNGAFVQPVWLGGR